MEGAYLLADQDDFVLVKFTGESVDVLCQVNEGYEKYVSVENGKKVLYLQLLKALYGCLRSALLWYELYSSKLQGMGFVLNPYDTCEANKVSTVSNAPLAITWMTMFLPTPNSGYWKR